MVENMEQDKLDLIKRTVAVGATNDELALFLYTAKRTGLDPLTKQIHFIKRRQWNKSANGYIEVGTTQTGIDGYRAIATRTGELAGIDDAVYDSEEGVYPKKAAVTVYRLVNGVRTPFSASARWNEYVSTDRDGNPVAMWKKMPYLMLAKVAEALALRKAFPNDLSGLYTAEEMSQADNTKTYQSEYDTSPVADDAVPTIHIGGDKIEPPSSVKTTLANKKEIASLVDKVLVNQFTGSKEARAEQYAAWVKAETGLALEVENYETIIERLKSMQNETH